MCDSFRAAAGTDSAFKIGLRHSYGPDAACTPQYGAPGAVSVIEKPQKAAPNQRLNPHKHTCVVAVVDAEGYGDGFICAG